MGESWYARFLGGFDLRRSDGTKEHVRSMKMALLLGCLAAAPGRQFSRDELLARLWPDEPVEAAQNSLRVTLSRLRALLGESTLETTRRYIRLVPGTLTSDVAQFEDAVHARRWREAKASYGGPYLPGVYDDQTVANRERLESLYREACNRVHALGDVLAPSAVLPSFLTRFVRRERECERLAQLLLERRLVTLVGPGGIGKTRLAIELATSLRERFDLIAFVPLDECFDIREFPECIRRALPGSDTDGPARQILAACLRERGALLVLDNLEQLVESGAAEAVETLLTSLPTLRCLVTSRCPLGIVGEQLFPLAPLPLEHATELFVDRARTAFPDFVVDDASHTVLAALCGRLDGIPLAIELAASRVGALSLTEIRQQLDQGLKVLVQPRKSGRQASVHDTIAWSWHRLPTHLQEFLACLSVFRSGWSPAAAAAVGAREDAAECLDALREASLIVRDEGPSGSRYHLLELIRTFASEQVAGSLQQAAEARHRAFFAANGGREEGENVLAALRSAVVAEDGLTASSIFLRHADGALETVGIPLTLEAGRAVLPLPTPSPEGRMRILGKLVQLADTVGDAPLADALHQEALMLAECCPSLRPQALAIEGQLAVSRNRLPETVIPALQEALHLLEAHADIPTYAAVLRRLGILLLRCGRFDEAQECFVQSENLCIREGDVTGARYALGNRAHVLAEQGDQSGALALYLVCLERSRNDGDRQHEIKNLLNIGSLQAALGRWEEARDTTRACLRLCRVTGNLRSMAFALWNLPEPLLHLGETHKAAVLIHFAEHFWLERFEVLTSEDRTYRDSILARSGTDARTCEAGRSLSLNAALDLALT